MEISETEESSQEQSVWSLDVTKVPYVTPMGGRSKKYCTVDYMLDELVSLVKYERHKFEYKSDNSWEDKTIYWSNSDNHATRSTEWSINTKRKELQSSMEITKPAKRTDFVKASDITFCKSSIFYLA